MDRMFAEVSKSEGEGGESQARPPRWDMSKQLADAEAAYDLIVKRADEWGVDTHRIGMIGFSAGLGSPCIALSTPGRWTWPSSAPSMAVWTCGGAEGRSPDVQRHSFG
jgi:hypothetical protein